MEWSPNGSRLAIIQDKLSDILFWNASTGTSSLDFGLKSATSLAWNPAGTIVCIGTAKGHLSIIDVDKRMVSTIMAKHTKAITEIVWIEKDKFVCASEDKTVSPTSVIY